MTTPQKQSQNERRTIRREYRTLIQETQAKKQDLIQPDSQGLLDVLKKVDVLYSKVQQPREAALDSELLSLTSQLGYEQAQRFKVAPSSFDTVNFITRLRNSLVQLGEDNEVTEDGWNKFGEQVSSKFNDVPVFDFMYGPMNIEIVEKTRKAPVRRQKDDVGKLETAEKIDDSTKMVAESTSGRVQAMKSYIENKKKIDEIDTLTDQKSFSRTVENIFYFSFLLKDGQAKLASDEDGIINIQVSQPPDEADYTTGKAKQRHSIVKMDYETWMEWKKISTQQPDFDLEELAKEAMRKQKDAEPHANTQDDRQKKKQKT
ncbi:hypothetical protein PPL_09047 [Heterostelium album PN500]|uniref:Non-structural maintenance of chromosomes element 4 n=1 Tax=Heterostelium pallidum (strain ATCC 26659 / Pp 5 / PN500) TaxID=670386 RepID=D3BKG6_HETP5|nr:hypothetical protein PPL_09047 [Heterostelium album PN500]EFA78396.1 hypothetical protein PPL_09047 [Heterostelium album PN500]|eukprot:XP_020430521.1 hypothetical protein PPL_09047 [Heterostelium album PN500]